jgi:hypothetical protein
MANAPMAATLGGEHKKRCMMIIETGLYETDVSERTEIFLNFSVDKFVCLDDSNSVTFRSVVCNFENKRILQFRKKANEMQRQARSLTLEETRKGLERPYGRFPHDVTDFTTHNQVCGFHRAHFSQFGLTVVLFQARTSSSTCRLQTRACVGSAGGRYPHRSAWSRSRISVHSQESRALAWWSSSHTHSLEARSGACLWACAHVVGSAV